MESLQGGSGDDIFFFQDAARLAGGAGRIDGGEGINTLDYSAYTTAVGVNLTAGTATGTAGVANIRDVVGGSGGDTLTGDAEDNRLTGNAGNDTLAGGTGDDRYVFADGWGADTVTEAAEAPTRWTSPPSPSRSHSTSAAA